MLSLLPDHSITFWISATCAVMLLGISKAGFGAGVGMIATPLMALTIPVADAAALLLPLLIFTDIIAVYNYRLHFDRRSVKLMFPGALIGILAGSLFFGYFIGKDRIMKSGIGILAVVFVLFQLGRRYIMGAIGKHDPPAAEGVLMGAVAGFTSTMAHAGGPPVAVFLLPQKLPPRLYVGTTVIFFAITNAIKLIPYWSLGLLRVGNLMTITLLAPAAYIGTRLGLYFNKRFSEKWFNVLVYTVLFLTGIELIAGKGLVGMLFK